MHVNADPFPLFREPVHAKITKDAILNRLADEEA